MTEPEKIKKIAIFHAFFKNRGGAEKLVFELRNHLGADLYTGALRTDIFSADGAKDSFSRELFNPDYKLEYLHADGKIPVLLHLKRMWYFLFSSKIKELDKYHLVIFSGNVFFVQRRLKKAKKITYCHTPPRLFTDQQKTKAKKLPSILRPVFNLVGWLFMSQYKADIQSMDLVVSNSLNIQDRLQKYVGVESQPIYPPINTERFKYISTGDYFLSYSRLEDEKRIQLILEAFANMPEKKLVICSTGPLESWVKEQIVSRNLKNISFEGLVSDERLQELVGNCLTGITIPVDEDAGIVQCELMAAGKPVIGVAEGGLLETIIDDKTGFLLPANPRVEDLVRMVRGLDLEKVKSMKDDCIEHSKQFDSSVFFEKMDRVLELIINNE